MNSERNSHVCTILSCVRLLLSLSQGCGQELITSNKSNLEEYGIAFLILPDHRLRRERDVLLLDLGNWSELPILHLRESFNAHRMHVIVAEVVEENT